MRMEMLALPILLLTMLAVGLAGAANSPIQSCANLSLNFGNSFDSTKNATCYWSGGNLSIYVATGDPGWLGINVVGQNGTTYLSTSTTNWCLFKLATIYMPSQNYTVTAMDGNGGGACPTIQNAIVKFAVANNSSASNITTSVPGAAFPSGSSSQPSSTTIPAPAFPANASRSGSVTTSTGKSSGGSNYAILYLFIIIFSYVAALYFKVKKRARMRNRRSTIVSDSQTGSFQMSGSPGGSAATAGYAQARGLNGANLRGNGRVVRTVIYTGGGVQDSFDGM
ncbi:MAG: hypothetical protein ACP5UC_02585 [Candidatus Micrarchaeia archaeon]